VRISGEREEYREKMCELNEKSVQAGESGHDLKKEDNGYILDSTRKKINGK
jgi:hypothetical protein